MPCGGEVLPELPVADRPAELALPEVEVLAGEGVDGLVDPAVVLGVGDLVALEPERVCAHRTGHRTLVDRGAPDAGPLRLPRGADVH